MRLSIPTALVALAAALLLAAPAAQADLSDSTNWAGFAVHRSGVRFMKVLAQWTQPGATCTRGRQTYSAIWVGIGGFSESSNALEQVGTEIDCSASGQARSSAWYELVPAASQPISLPVRPGDVLAASVTVVGHRVTVGLNDLTHHRSFSKTLHAPTVDIGSAEWIVEAPSDCISDTNCQTLPLANFGSAIFNSASAQSTTRHVGSISDPAWDSTKIRLAPGGRRFVVYNGSGPSTGAAVPSRLAFNGSSFAVNYVAISAQGSPFFARRSAAVDGGYLVHPGR